MATRARVDSPSPKPPTADIFRKPAPTILGPSSAAAARDMLRQPPAAPAAPPPADVPTDSGYVSGGGGGGGGGGGAVPFSAPPMSFDDYIAKDFGYNQTKNEGSRRLQDFEAQTLLGRQQTEADQNMRRAALQQTLSQMGGDWANDAANRGILRSGLYLQGQDKVDQQGVTGNQDIDQLLTQFITGRQSEKVNLEQQNRSALNDVLSQLSQKYNSGLAIA